MVRAVNWLTCLPVAHRGLHGTGHIENTLPAVAAAVDAGFAVEVDVRLSADGCPVVFHDDRLERLTHGEGPIAERTGAEIAQIAFRDGSATRIPTLADVLDLVAGKAPLFIEVKAETGGSGRLEQEVARCLRDYRGPAAVMSFCPRSVAALARGVPGRPRGLVSGRRSGPVRHACPAPSGAPPPSWPAPRFLLAVLSVRPHFIAYDIRGLPAFEPALTRRFGLPLLTWTVRSQAEGARAATLADQMIFEGFRPQP